MDKKKVILVSLYCDIKQEAIQQDLINAVEYSKEKRLFNTNSSRYQLAQRTLG